ncbi:MAG: CBS domain-containing protein [Halobacteriota archaeon]
MVSVREYISAPVILLKSDATVSDALALVMKSGHQGFPVVTNRRLVGVVTSADLILAKPHQKIATLMTADPVTAKPDDDIVSIAGVMAYNHIRHVPIVDGERVLGIVTATDMLRAIIENVISENVERIFTFFQTLHPNVTIRHMRVGVASLIPTQKLLDPAELQLREQQFKRGVIYPIVVAKKGRFYYIIDGHHRAYLAYKRGAEEIPAFFIEGELGIVKSSEKLGLKSLNDMVLMSEA